MSIKAKLLYIAVFSFLAIVVLGVLLFFSYQQFNEAIGRSSIANQIATGVYERRLILDEYLLDYGDVHRDEWLTKNNDLARLLQSLSPKFSEVRYKEVINNLLIKFAINRKVFLELSEVRGAENIKEEKLTSQLLFNTQEIISDTKKFAALSVEEARHSEETAVLLLGSFSVVLVLIIFGIIFVFWFSIVRPIIKFREGTEIISSGNFKHRVVVSSHDEIGQLAKSFNDMAGRLQGSYAGLEEKVHARTEALAQAQSLAHIGSWEWEIGSNNMIWSDELYRVFGVTRQEVPQSYYAYLQQVFPDDLEKVEVAIQNTLETHEPFEFDHRIKLPDGTSRWVRGRGAVIMDAKGVPVKMEGTAQDITKEKEIDRQKNEFISIVSHQLRTPLGSMRWNLELLQSETHTLSEEAQGRVNEMYKSDLRLIRLVGDLLNVARIEGGRTKDEPELSEIFGIVESAIKEMEPEANKKSVALAFSSVETAIPKIMIDPKRFREVIQNLLSNAVRYTLPKGRVSVRVDYSDNLIKISVADTGIGIPKGEQSRLFVKFARAENAVKIDTEGTGLGLFIVKSYVEDWGGKVWFESIEGKGTTFYVSLPIKPNVVNITKETEDHD
ncbi:MAG: ATP-binding protein [Patescibacteria group bacterium]|nr:ATP-binding protein [Patescibacteria group bacterium]